MLCSFFVTTTNKNQQKANKTKKIMKFSMGKSQRPSFWVEYNRKCIHLIVIESIRLNLCASKLSDFNLLCCRVQKIVVSNHSTNFSFNQPDKVTERYWPRENVRLQFLMHYHFDYNKTISILLF